MTIVYHGITVHLFWFCGGLVLTFILVIMLCFEILVANATEEPKDEW